jgi:hypothetical protein
MKPALEMKLVFYFWEFQIVSDLKNRIRLNIN